MNQLLEFGSILTSDPFFQEALQMAANVATSKATVLITGESGTGKELLARFIHSKSPRVLKNFVAINCAAVPEGLLESELFGYERGAFTGATSQKIGKFEISSGSTLLLDEISEMPLPLQAKILRVIQEEEVDRLGGRSPVKVNLRLVATANKDLGELVRVQKFREDLYYRLNVIPLHIPPLRERPSDIVVLAENFIKVSAILNSRSAVKLSFEATEKLKSWHWPGNVRELENVIERAVLICSGDEVRGEHILIEGHQKKNPNRIVLSSGVTIAEMEKQLIFKTLHETGQNRTRAAKILGISIRTLRNKLSEYRTLEVSNG